MPYAGPLDGTIKGTCTNCQQEGDEDCDACVEEARMAWACACTCHDLGFRAAAVSEPHEDCNCSTGITRPGGIITGALIGWTRLDSTLMDELRAAARKRSGSEDVKLRLYGNGTTGGPDMHCNVGIAGWTLLPINEAGDLYLINPAGGEIEDGESGPTGGGTSLTAEQLGLEIDPVEGGTGTDCAQTGGHRMFKAIFSTVGGGGEDGTEDIFLVECKFTGVTGAAPCTTVQCCDWNISGTQNSGCSGDGGLAAITVDVSRPESCVKIPIATLTITTPDAEDTVYDIDSSLHFQRIEHAVEPCTLGQTVRATLRQTYPPDSGCADPDDQFQDFTL